MASPLLACRSVARVTAVRGCVVSDISTHVCRRQTAPDASRPDREAKPHGRRASACTYCFNRGKGSCVHHQCDRSIPTESNCETDHGARLFSNRCRKEVRNGFTPGSGVRLLQPIMREREKGYAARLGLTTGSRERCFSFLCSVETTLRPRSASCTSSRWIACRRSCLRP
jgi:hypothetical protein